MQAIPIISIIFIILITIMIIYNLKIKSLKHSKPESFDPFKVAQIESRGVQFLESIHIISTTNNIERFEAHVRKIMGFYSTFVVMSTFKQQYGAAAIIAIETYNNQYPGLLNEVQGDLMFVPGMDKLKAYIANAMVVSYSEFVKLKLEETSVFKPGENAYAAGERDIILNTDRILNIYEDFNIPRNESYKAIIQIHALTNTKNSSL